VKSLDKILLRSPNWVGDTVMATPVSHLLRHNFPQAKIHILAKPWVAPLWENNPAVDKIIILDRKKDNDFLGWFKLVRSLQQEKYNTIINLPNSFSSAWLSFWLGAKNNIGYATELRDLLLTKKLSWTSLEKITPRPAVYIKLLSLLNSGLVYSGNKWPFIVAAKEDELVKAEEILSTQGQGLKIGLAPGAVAKSRRWPWERYIQLSEILTSQGKQVIILGSKQDKVLADKITVKLGNKVLNLAGKTTLREAIAIIKKLDLLVSNDSGNVHLAYAQNIPVLVLRGAGDDRVTGPFGEKSFKLRADKVACAPCVRNVCPYKDFPCMTKITVKQVVDKIAEIIAQSL